MAAVLGMRGSGSWSSDERPTNYREMILYMYPNAKAPMMALLSKLGDESVDDPKYTFFMKGLPAQRVGVGGGGYNDSDNPVTITLDSGGYTYCKPGHAVMNERTLEVMWVTSVTTDQIVCQRDVGSALAAGLNTDSMLVVGSAHEEGADTPASRAYDPTTDYNYTQIFRNSVNQTGTARATHLRTGDQVKAAQKECMLLHHIEMEKAFIFGRRKEYTGGSQPKRTTGGFLQFVTTNVLDLTAPTPLDIDTWETYLESIFSYGSESKLILCGARVVNMINKLARVNSTVDLVPKSSSYGMNIWSYQSPFGEVMFKTHPLFSENATFTSWGLVIDAAHMKYRFLKGRDTKYLPNRQGAGIDGVLDEYLTEAGYELRHQVCHGVIKGLTSVTL